MTERVLLVLVGVTAAIFAGVFFAAEEFQAAGLAVAAGLVWFLLEVYRRPSFPAVFFLLYFGMAVWGSLHDLSVPLMLLGVSANLAAWDMSRFRSRFMQVGEGDIDPVLEAQHLRKLALTAGVGFIAALLPLALTLSINFLTLAVLALLLVILLRRFVLSLRPEEEIG